jgi:HD-GYP domain-containing protein (c-di-GMP phosphodiesterase class II)
MAQKTTDYKSIISLNSELNKIQDLDLLLERILLEARKVVKADAGSIYVKEKCYEGGKPVDKLVIKYAQNDTLRKNTPLGKKMNYSIFATPFAMQIDEGSIAGYCALTGKIINVADMYSIPDGAPYHFNSAVDKSTGYRCTSSLTFPLIAADGRMLGVIQVFNAMDDERNIARFTGEDEFLITHFAANATIALQRALENRAMILRMIKMSELHDPKETGTHVNRVAGYAVEIYDRWAQKRQIDPAEREQVRDILRIGAILHDVGKVAISDIILKKPSRFTPEEYLIMQKHSSYGAALFDDPQSPTDKMAGEIALTHHENWDGSGYPGWIDPVTGAVLKAGENGKPLGKKGEEIPLAGRIVAIADVYDALCSKRVYKEPWGEEETLREMRRMSGTKFDPELVDIFFEILPNIKQAQSLYPEKEDS